MTLPVSQRAADDYDNIPQDAIDLYDAFTHGSMPRRAFMERLTLLAGGATAATVLLGRLQNSYAHAALVAPDDARLTIEDSSFTSPDGPITVQVASVKGAPKAPAVLVIHENRGLNPHIRDVGRRLALEGFATFAIDVLTPEGGTPSDEDAARELIGKIEPPKSVARLAAGIDFAKAHRLSTGKVGAVGFCWGGGMANNLAIASADMRAAVAYYGRQPATADVVKIKGAVLLHYAGKDERINAGIAEYETALKAAKTDYVLHMYDGAQHAFNNDTNAARYDKVAADLAWGRTVAFLKAKLA